jgi:hypothetical protein
MATLDVYQDVVPKVCQRNRRLCCIVLYCASDGRDTRQLVLKFETEKDHHYKGRLALCFQVRHRHLGETVQQSQ